MHRDFRRLVHQKYSTAVVSAFGFVVLLQKLLHSLPDGVALLKVLQLLLRGQGAGKNSNIGGDA